MGFKISRTQRFASALKCARALRQISYLIDCDLNTFLLISCLMEIAALNRSFVRYAPKNRQEIISLTILFLFKARYDIRIILRGSKSYVCPIRRPLIFFFVDSVISKRNLNWS
jgi:hypothetical protein